jgi:hypothetical protein
VKVAREFDDVELVGIESPLWPKTYMGSGWVTQEAYETFVGRMIAEIKAEEPFLGTVRLDALPYQNVDLRRYYPYGEPAFPS